MQVAEAKADGRWKAQRLAGRLDGEVSGGARHCRTVGDLPVVS